MILSIHGYSHLLDDELTVFRKVKCKNQTLISSNLKKQHLPDGIDCCHRLLCNHQSLIHLWGDTSWVVLNLTTMVQFTKSVSTELFPLYTVHPFWPHGVVHARTIVCGIHVLWDGTTFKSINGPLEVAQAIVIRLLQTVPLVVGLEPK